MLDGVAVKRNAAAPGCRNCYDPIEIRRIEATWRSGDAADCKSAHPGSIPGVASKFIEAGKGRMERDETI